MIGAGGQLAEEKRGNLRDQMGRRCFRGLPGAESGGWSGQISRLEAEES